jgi:Tol biopolymer transport system component
MRKVAFAVGLLLVAATPATADFHAVNGRIAYERVGRIWLTNQDGSDQRDVAAGNQPAWSADGKHVAYVAGASDVVGELMVMNADGSDQRTIDTDLGPNISTPSWSPDGTQIVVAAFGDLYAVPVAGRRSRLVASNGSNPAWSPDGSLIAFTRGVTTIMLVKPDGSDLHPLVPSGTANTANPPISWSPDGKRVAFTGVSDGGIDAVNVDGTGLVQILPHGQFGRTQPVWSPDGTRIAFLDNGDLCTAAIGGADVARLTWTPITTQPPGRPAWQPLAVSSTAAGVPGRSVGPQPGYPRGMPWYPSCDLPDDHVTMSSSGRHSRASARSSGTR